ncbi:MAG: LLM class F420-dependent oxidoreductase [Candidatus Dormibacteraeota bacterium]|nr:LLM class F420-dependent oxidoreductase [Candidatus Dormibacteraeota bacterium]
MKLGISLVRFSWPLPGSEIGPVVGQVAETADEIGLDSLWTMDHFFQIRMSGLPTESPMLEAYGTLGFMAARTRRIRLGALVTAVPYRHPGPLIKLVTTLDVLSGGRMIFGVGAGAPYSAPDFDPLRPDPTAEPRIVEQHEVGGLGIPFLSLGKRFGQLEELLQIAHQMWRGDETPFAGTYYRLNRPLNSPNSVQRPHPPILIGGGGEHRTLRLVARYADACNLFDAPDRFQEDLPRKLEVLRRHCRELGRDHREIEKTVAVGEIDPSAHGGQALVEHLRQLAELGIEHAILGGPGGGRSWDRDSLQALAPIVNQAHDLEPAALAV